MTRPAKKPACAVAGARTGRARRKAQDQTAHGQAERRSGDWGSGPVSEHRLAARLRRLRGGERCLRRRRPSRTARPPPSIRPRPSRARGPAPRRRGAAAGPVASRSRAASRPEARAAQEHVADASRPARGGRRRRPRRAGRAGPSTIGWASSPRSAATREHVVRGVAVAAGERRVGLLGDALDPRQLAPDRPRGRAGSRACGTARRRASRSTRRSTVILAIRRQVVSLPPVIVIMPLTSRTARPCARCRRTSSGRRWRSAAGRPRRRR